MPQTQTYNGRSTAGVLNSTIREDLLDVISNIDPTESQLLSGLGSSVAHDILHQWPLDTLDAPGSAKVAEGSDPVYALSTQPSRATNHTELIRKEYQVSDTARKVVNAGFDDVFAYQKMKAMKNWRNAAEFDLMRSTLACGASGTARQMTGLKAAITTLATNPSGVSLSETMLNAYLSNAWDQGGEPDSIYVGKVLKQRISGFTAGNVKNVAAEDRRLVNSVDVYVSDFSIVKIMLHRYITQSGDSNLDIVGIQEDLFKLAWLSQPVDVEVGKTGSSTKGYIEGELTLEFRNQKSSFITTGVL